MPDQKLIDETVCRLVSLTRCTHIKRALNSAEPDPQLNFWRVIYGMLLDTAVWDWCVVFGAYGEKSHWTNVVPEEDHAEFRSGLLAATGLNQTEWDAYWKEMKTYRDNHLAHMGDRKPGDIFPRLEHALKSAAYYYEWLVRKGLVPGYPPSLSDYADEFCALAEEVAKAALEATRDIKERVDGAA